jgi:hypothetical protein
MTTNSSSLFVQFGMGLFAFAVSATCILAAVGPVPALA